MAYQGAEITPFPRNPCRAMFFRRGAEEGVFPGAILILTRRSIFKSASALLSRRMYLSARLFFFVGEVGVVKCCDVFKFCIFVLLFTVFLRVLLSGEKGPTRARTRTVESSNTILSDSKSEVVFETLA